MNARKYDTIHLALIGSAGVPNRYGGFEAFLEHCSPVFASKTASTRVTCDSRLYDEQPLNFHGVLLQYIPTPANGKLSVLHDLLAFFAVFRKSTHIVVLGVSGGPWFPLFRFMCAVAGKRLLVNIDGVEWRRTKHSRVRRLFLRLFDAVAQFCAHVVIYDNPALREFVLGSCQAKAICISYSGDHVIRLPGVPERRFQALTICRIEPENNLDMLIKGALLSRLENYTIVGNWAQSAYGRALRERYAKEPRLSLLDPIYEPEQLAMLRESCSVYLHGHSVGGTNPSLVEILFYDCAIFCFDVPFNRETAGDCAGYFSSAADLATLDMANLPGLGDRIERRLRYARSHIAEQYLTAMVIYAGTEKKKGRASPQRTSS
jgi:glycosyltransferase involved in cell wall biosynthesis